MELLSPFEFGVIYHFKNDRISEKLNKDVFKFHIYVGSRVLHYKEQSKQEIEHHFFLINSEARKIYKPHHPIFAGTLEGEYKFLKHNSYVGCRETFPVTRDFKGKKLDIKGKVEPDDMKKVADLYADSPAKNNQIVKFINECLESY